MQHVWINHDFDLLDVTLHTADAAHPTAATSDAKQRAVALRAHGLRAPPDDQADLASSSATTVGAAAGATQDETVHTTANHPWLTTDRGWVPAGELHSGEQIVREGGSAAPATVTALRVVAGAADYYNLTVSVLHTYAVGDGQYVVHNCNGTPVNLKGEPYPEVTDIRTGKPVPFPDGEVNWTPPANRVEWDSPQTGFVHRAAYIKEWYDQGYSTPDGGWKQYQLHHILPREYGGTNDFRNLVPLKADQHLLFTNWWKAYPK